MTMEQYLIIHILNQNFMNTEIRHMIVSSGRRIIAAALVLWYFTGLSFSQSTVSSFKDTKNQGEWWYPLLKKHNIDPSRFTFGSNLKPAADNVGGYTALELGDGASMVDSVMTIKKPVFIIMGDKDEYSIVKAESADHALSLRKITFTRGTVETFKFNSTDVSAVRNMTFDMLQIDTKTKRAIVKGIVGEAFTSQPHK